MMDNFKLFETKAMQNACETNKSVEGHNFDKYTWSSFNAIFGTGKNSHYVEFPLSETDPF